MIVVDTNVLAYLLIGGPQTAFARRALLKDPEWSAPLLWRSEFRSVMSLYMRKGVLDFKGALRLAGEAEEVMKNREYCVDTSEVMRLVGVTPLSAYDCEFLALALRLRLPLVTTDAQLLRASPDIAVSLQEFSQS